MTPTIKIKKTAIPQKPVGLTVSADKFLVGFVRMFINLGYSDDLINYIMANYANTVPVGETIDIAA